VKRAAELFQAGGPVMWPILGLSVLGLAILLWKASGLRKGRRDRRGLATVSTIITAEPMLGILGTVTGIMQTFSSFDAASGTVNPFASISGIGEALTTTAAGLVAALVLLFPYNALDAAIEDGGTSGGGPDGDGGNAAE